MKHRSVLNRIAHLTFLIVLGLGMAGHLHAQAQNLDKSGRALQGYDPVAFFTNGKPVKGDPNIHSSINGATYYFASAEAKGLFEKSPEKYIPQFGGYCAYGVSKGDLVKIDVEAFQIVDGRLLLQYSKGVRDKFNKDTQGNLKAADANWPAVSKKKPATGLFGG